MKIEKPENSNYSATVVRLKALVPLERCDNVVGTPIFGFQAVISKDHKVGDLGIVLPVETQLSHEFCFYNNLYRHPEQNSDTTQKGYIEDNRRIRAQKFRGNVSNCLFMSLDSLKFTGIKVTELKEGDEFDNLNGKEICRKYYVPKKTYTGASKQEKKPSRIENKHFPEHIDTLNFFKFSEGLSPNLEVSVTQKLHGTSIRVGNIPAKRKLKFADRLGKVFGAKIQETQHDYVFGSRKVIKDANNPDQNHFYDSDIWTEQGKKLQGLLPENYIVYAELIGWTSDGKEIQRNYSYALPVGTSELYIYRIAIVNSSGHLTDLTWSQVKEFCNKNGLKHVPELWTGKLGEVEILKYIDKRFFDGTETAYRNALWLGENKLVDEGVCVRIDGLTPQLYKAKSPIFLEHETNILDKGEEDLESAQTV